MDEDIREILENIRIMTRKYRSVPGAAAETVNSLLDEIEAVRERVQRGLASIASFEQSAPDLFKEIGEALQEAREAAVAAEFYLQQELKETGRMLRQLHAGNRARRAYQRPAVGMGFTDGSFVDRKK